MSGVCRRIHTVLTIVDSQRIITEPAKDYGTQCIGRLRGKPSVRILTRKPFPATCWSLAGPMQPERLSALRRLIVANAEFDAEKAKALLLARVDITDSCWFWRATRDINRYGGLRAFGRVVSAHRLSYQAFVGDIPPGMLVCHRCDNPSCINPEHLWLGTARDNSRDMRAKGRCGMWRHPESFERVRQGVELSRIRLSSEEVAEIRRLHAVEGMSFSAIARRVVTSRWVVADVIRGKRYSNEAR